MMNGREQLVTTCLPQAGQPATSNHMPAAGRATSKSKK